MPRGARRVINGCDVSEVDDEGGLCAIRALVGEAALPLAELVKQGLVEYVPFPEALVGKYQCFTQADLTRLRATGCAHQFADVATGVRRYADWLAGQA